MLLLIMHFMIKILIEGIIEGLSLWVGLDCFGLDCFSDVELAPRPMRRLATATAFSLLPEHNKIIPWRKFYNIKKPSSPSSWRSFA